MDGRHRYSHYDCTWLDFDKSDLLQQCCISLLLTDRWMYVVTFCSVLEGVSSRGKCCGVVPGACWVESVAVQCLPCCLKWWCPVLGRHHSRCSGMLCLWTRHVASSLVISSSTDVMPLSRSTLSTCRAMSMNTPSRVPHCYYYFDKLQHSNKLLFLSCLLLLHLMAVFQMNPVQSLFPLVLLVHHLSQKRTSWN